MDKIRVKVFLRSLALQASWNSRRMQSLGLVFAMYPWIKQSDLSLKEKVVFCRRHLVFFNTNPYYANFLIGGLIRLEADNYNQVDGSERLVVSYKEPLGRALASLGDQCFWLGVRPAVLIVAIIAGARLGPLFGLIPIFMFAIAQLFLRWQALMIGFESGLNIADLMTNPLWHKSIKFAKYSATLLTGVLLTLVLFWVHGNMKVTGTSSNIYVMIASVILYLLLRRKVPAEGIVLLAIPVLAVLSYL
jgi:mannose PTS system EIID component